MATQDNDPPKAGELQALTHRRANDATIDLFLDASMSFGFHLSHDDQSGLINYLEHNIELTNRILAGHQGQDPITMNLDYAKATIHANLDAATKDPSKVSQADMAILQRSAHLVDVLSESWEIHSQLITQIANTDQKPVDEGKGKLDPARFKGISPLILLAAENEQVEILLKQLSPHVTLKLVNKTDASPTTLQIELMRPIVSGLQELSINQQKTSRAEDGRPHPSLMLSDLGSHYVQEALSTLSERFKALESARGPGGRG